MATPSLSKASATPSSSIPALAMILGVVSIASFMWFLGIPAIVLGILGLKKYPENRGLSITGLVTGIVSTILFVLGTLLLLVALILAVISADTSHMTPSPYNEQSDSIEYRHYRDLQENF
ncbi:MAG: DUF4190 domain-containing protein [Candidatus Saccharimonadales bacterium]